MEIQHRALKYLILTVPVFLAFVAHTNLAFGQDPDWVRAVAENPVVLIRFVFNYILTPVAVIAVFTILVKNVIRIVREGFREDKLEGYQRTCVAVLPFPFLAYAMIGAGPNGEVSGGLSAWLASTPEKGSGVFFASPTRRRPNGRTRATVKVGCNGRR